MIQLRLSTHKLSSWRNLGDNDIITGKFTFDENNKKCIIQITHIYNYLFFKTKISRWYPLDSFREVDDDYYDKALAKATPEQAVDFLKSKS